MKKLLHKIKQNFPLAIAIGVLSFILIFVIIIPVCINWLYKQAAPIKLFAVEWKADDALAFYGTLLASAATIVGVFVSVKYAQSNYHTDEINKVKPYFALSRYNSHFCYNPLEDFMQSTQKEASENETAYYYEEFKMERVYILIEKDGIRFMDGLPKEKKERLSHLGFEWESDGNKSYQLIRHHIISLPFDAENIGNGAALDTRIAFYPKGGTRKAASLYTIKKDTSFYFHIFCDDVDILANSEYEIALDYYDIIGNHYAQKYPVCFKGTSSITMDFSGKQEIIQPGLER